MNKEWIDRGKKVIMNTYSQLPIAFEKGEGMYLWDSDGNKYLDFVAGISVNALGYSNQAFITKTTEQLNKIVHISNIYWIPPSIELAEILVANSELNRVFFCNSGAEANEAALKLSRKYGKKKHGNDCYEIISLNHSFHGRTFATITATGQPKYQKGLDPLFPGIKYAELNSIEDLKSKISSKTCAIIIEPIQAEGGIHPCTQEFLQYARDVCDEKDIVLIFDEVQCGIGRSGKLFAYQLYNIIPDIITLAKGLAGGLPIGAMVANQEKADAFSPGDHASTFGGNYVACSGGVSVLNQIISEGFLNNVIKQGAYLQKKLEELKTKFSIISEVRGHGLLIGMEFSIPVKEIINKSLEKNLLLLNAGTNVIRFVPPLIVQQKEIDEMITILSNVIAEF